MVSGLHSLRRSEPAAADRPRCEDFTGRVVHSVEVKIGMRPLVAHCHLGLGKLSRRTGKRQDAHEHLTAATTMYREMDMRFWLEKAETEMGA